ncbi:MarR family winged helix-turn-helix transcriptional regulator [Methylobacterium sp. JK268]
MATSAESDSTPALGEIETLVGYHLRRASAGMGADFARVLAGTGMRQVLYGILSIVAANPGINQGAVGRALGIKRANMVVLVNELLELGWIDRTVSSEDRRAFALALSPAGRTVFAAATERLRAHEEAMLAALSAGERAQLIGLLGRIAGREGD